MTRVKRSSYNLPVKSYAQYCGLARALDVVGERWSLLIVRELLEGPRRYSELMAGLPGIATNLLVERLRGLEANEVIHRSEDGRYSLTPWGQDLHEVVYALGRWAGPLMARPRGDGVRVTDGRGGSPSRPSRGASERRPYPHASPMSLEFWRLRHVDKETPRWRTSHSSSTPVRRA